MQDGDVLVATDGVLAIVVDSVAGRLRMFLADFPLPKVVGFHNHHLHIVHGGGFPPGGGFQGGFQRGPARPPGFIFPGGLG